MTTAGSGAGTFAVLQAFAADMADDKQRTAAAGLQSFLGRVAVSSWVFERQVIQGGDVEGTPRW